MNCEQLLSRAFAKAHALDAARIVEQLPGDQQVQTLTELSPELAARIIWHLVPSAAAGCLEGMDTRRAAAIMRSLATDTAAILLRRMDAQERSAILNALPHENMRSLQLLLRFPKDTAGALMEPQVFTLPDDLIVREALKLIRRHPRFMLHHIPVIDREHVLVGLIKHVRDLLQAKPEATIATVMHSGVGRLLPNSTREAILVHPGWQVFQELPVVDESGVFLGVISYQTIRRLEAETRERDRAGAAHDAGTALGELYWIGMSAFFKGATTLASPDKKSE